MSTDVGNYTLNFTTGFWINLGNATINSAPSVKNHIITPELEIEVIFTPAVFAIMEEA